MKTASILLLISLVSLSAFALAGMYRWVDDNGETVYSQTPPPDGRPATSMKAPPPPAETPEQAQERLDQQLQKIADAEEDQELADKETQKEQQTSEDRKHNCEAARNNLEVLENRPARTKYRKADGSVVRLNYEERLEQLEKAKAQMEKYCN